MKPGRLYVGLVLLLVTLVTAGAVVVQGERDRRTSTGSDDAPTVLSAVPPAGPVAGGPRGSDGAATLGPTASSGRAPKSEAQLAAQARAKAQAKAQAKVKAQAEAKAKAKARAKAKAKAKARAKAKAKAEAQARARAKARAAAAKPAPRRPPSPARGGRIVYLTFDDGPGPSTPQVLRVLRETGSTATFFQLGVNSRGQQHLEAAIRAQGSTIGNHTWNHPDLTRLSAAQLRRQIADGPRSRCVRPPYGATNAAVRAAIARAGGHQVLWTVDSRDWTKPGTRTLERLGTSPLVHGGSIVLMHDGGGDRSETVAALPSIIKGWQRQGYVVRALSSCG